MWVYQQSAESSASISAGNQPDQATRQLGPAISVSPQQLPEQASHPPASTAIKSRARNLPRDCWALAAAYLFGTLLSGVMLALCQSSELELLSAYLGNWSALFTLDGSEAVWTLFRAEYLTAAGGATMLLLLGLSALGPVLIYLFAMFFGLGIGMITLQLFLESGWKAALPGLLLSGLTTAAAVTCLCLFGASALRVSGHLHQAAFGRGSERAAAGARSLLGQYLILNLLFLPICGASTALVCLARQMSAHLTG